MDKHASFRLGGHNEQDAYKVGRDAGPGSVGDRQHGAVDKLVDLVDLLLVDHNIVTLHLHIDTETAESGRKHAEIVHADIL